ncbi:DRTGG domain-containing protein [Marinicrinis sediminis]|uniref:DRTGG domain-containing protein n=1 Tax=Marinicrinis sediminis TaxID=1652465 RepID=A0ABW5RAJ6_9BACL
MKHIHQHVTKHEQILKYIESLEIGHKISVRGIAKEMEVSEGTAYRAIKEAENTGLVSTKERIGTVRIEKTQRYLDQLTFREVVDIVDGRVLGGSSGLDKTLNKFVIGAMELEDMKPYVDQGSLLIVGNRANAHLMAMEHGSGVLITGGFEIMGEVRAMADDKALPVISSKYDTFTVASMINRAMYDRIIKKKIMLVEDVMAAKAEIPFLRPGSQIADWKRLSQEHGQERFPVVDEWGRVIGIVTSKDVVNIREDQSIERVMTRNPLTVTSQTSIATAAHLMVWEGIELVPVVDHNRKLLSVVGRQEVLKAMQMSQHQHQAGETYEEQIWSSFEEQVSEVGEMRFVGTLTPQMTNTLGTGSEGVLTLLSALGAQRLIKEQKRGDLVMDNMSLYFIKPIQLEHQIVIRPKMIELSRRFGKVEVDIHHHDQIVMKALITAHVIEQG